MSKALVPSHLLAPAGTGNLDAYIQEVYKIPVLTLEEERDLATRYRDEEDLDPAIEDCNWDPDLSSLPQWPSQIRLGFFWFIAKRGAGNAGTLIRLVLRRAFGQSGGPGSADTVRFRSRGRSPRRG